VLARGSAQAAVAGPLELVAVLAAGGLALSAGRISAGELFAAGRYAVLGAGLGSLTGVLGSLARSRAAQVSVDEILGLRPFTFGPVSTPDGPGVLEFQGVSVHGLLHAVNLAVPAGAAVAVVGRSGAGKSVLAALAARLRDPDGGEVRLDGVPLTAFTEEALRTSIGCAFERPQLTLGTVSDSIRLGRQNFPVMAAAQAAHAHSFIARLPGGYDTPIAEAPMSGGEAQRLGLARAWCARRLLVLDDATSSLDMVTEREIAATLLAEGRTRLIVTHRVTTAERADLVVWLDNGRVRGVAPHTVLWAEPGYRAVFS
jgi:ATP-binding cassette subfamily B protein